jgi:hypothetical protein
MLLNYLTFYARFIGVSIRLLAGMKLLNIYGTYTGG